jgi:hypothetical protein
MFKGAMKGLNKSGSGLPHSRTLARSRDGSESASGFGVPQSPAALTLISFDNPRPL